MTVYGRWTRAPEEEPLDLDGVLLAGHAAAAHGARPARFAKPWTTRSGWFRKVEHFQGILRNTPRPGIEPGLGIRAKQNQIHQKKTNDFGLFRATALPQFVQFRLVFRPTLPKFCPRISKAPPRFRSGLNFARSWAVSASSSRRRRERRNTIQWARRCGYGPYRPRAD